MQVQLLKLDRKRSSEGTTNHTGAGRNCSRATGYLITVKVKFAYEPSGPCYQAEARSNNECLYFLLYGTLVHRRVTPTFIPPVPIYTPSWREALRELSVLPKNTTQFLWPGLDPETSVLIMHESTAPYGALQLTKNQSFTIPKISFCKKSKKYRRSEKLNSPKNVVPHSNQFIVCKIYL